MSYEVTEQDVPMVALPVSWRTCLVHRTE